MSTTLKNVLTFMIVLAICLSVGFLGSIFTTPSIPVWYAGLNKPSFNPPNYIFGPVWTVLYIFMAIAFYMIWRKKGETPITFAVSVFVIQLILNFLWSVIFFGMHYVWLAFVEIIILWFFIAVTIKSFYRISQYTIVFLIPYILWVTFAAVLNYFIFIMN